MQDAVEPVFGHVFGHIGHVAMAEHGADLAAQDLGIGGERLAAIAVEIDIGNHFHDLLLRLSVDDEPKSTVAQEYDGCAFF